MNRMNFDHTSSYDYKGMCAELGIEYSAFLAFINGNNSETDRTTAETDKPLFEAIDLFLSAATVTPTKKDFT